MSKIIIGVTGGFSAGKSTVSDLLAVRGAHKIDADEIAHEILEKDEKVKEKIVDLFGQDVLISGNIDRHKLGHLVFDDRKKFDLLDKIIHPVIFEKIERNIADTDKEFIVIDAPLLIESGLYKNVDYIVVVAADEQQQIARGRSRGYKSATVKKIILSQYSMNEKIKLADFVLKNNQGIDKLKEGVDKLWRILGEEKKKS